MKTPYTFKSHLGELLLVFGYNAQISDFFFFFFKEKTPPKWELYKLLNIFLFHSVSWVSFCVTAQRNISFFDCLVFHNSMLLFVF